MTNILLASGQITLAIAITASLLVRMKHSRHVFFLSFSNYALVLALFYVCLPATIQSLTGISFVGSELGTIQTATAYGFYFILVLYLTVLFRGKPALAPVKLNSSPLNGHVSKIALFLVLVLSAYILFVILLNLEALLALVGDRAAQSNMNHYLETVYKVRPVYLVLVLHSSFLVLKSGRRVWLVYLLPFLILDVILSGRMYLFSTLLVYVVLSSYLGKTPRVFSLIVCTILVLSIAVIRTAIKTGNLQFDILLQVFGEFLFTWEVVSLIVDSEVAKSFPDALLYSLLRTFPSIVYVVINGEDYVSYTSIAESANPLGWGLSGSIIAESLAFKNWVIAILFPWIFSFFIAIVDALALSRKYSARILFVTYVVYALPIFRYSFLEMCLYPLYCLIFYGTFLLLNDMLLRNWTLIGRKPKPISLSIKR